MSIDISAADPGDPEVAAVLKRHLDLMQSQTPAESCHALPGDALNAPGITLLAARDTRRVLGVGAIKLDEKEAELKSMHTVAEARGRGVARALLEALVAQAVAAGVARLNLETGAGEEHAAARHLYQSAGFAECGPFGDYAPDPLSVFMTRAL